MATNPPKVSIQPASNGWTRRDRPCDACRRRKSRCIIPSDSETCIMCQSRQEECTFVQKPQGRKRRKVEGGDAGSPGDGTKPSSPTNERLMNSKPPLNDYTNLPHSLLKQTLGLQNRQHSQYLGQTSSYDTRLINLTPFNNRGEFVSSPGTLRRVSPQTHFIMKSESQAEMDDELTNLDLVESIVQPHGKALVDLYFRIVHPSFPIMHKNVFLEKYARTYREFTPPILAAVYILALNWWSYSPDLVNLPKPDVQKLEKLAPKFMSDVLNRPKLSTVQAGLLLLQRPGGDSWALTGQLVAIAQELGLHLDCSKWKIPEWERSLRKRLAWALFMQDKWGALIHGRPSLIHLHDWSVRPVELRDFPETASDDSEEEGSSEIEKGRLSFINMISLTEILTDILDTFFTLRATASIASEGDNAIAVTLERAKPVQLKLKEWYSKLPPCLAVGETKARKLSSTGSLHLSYFALEITLHRAILRPFPPLSPISPIHPLHPITRAAAKTRFTSAIDLINKLEQTHLQSFWYFASKTNLAIIATFGSLLWATSESEEERNWYRERLAEYRWLLRVSSKSAEFMGFTVGMLDASAVFVREKEGKNSGVGSLNPGGEVAGNEGDEMMSDHEEEDEGNEDIKAEHHHSSHSNLSHQNQNQAQTNNNNNYDYAQNMSYFPSEQVSPMPSISAASDHTNTNTHTNAPSYNSNSYHDSTNTTNNPLDVDTRPNWSNLGLSSSNNVEFSSGDIQDWNLDQLYNFENFPLADDVVSHSRRYVREYDESGNAFAGF